MVAMKQLAIGIAACALAVCTSAHTSGSVPSKHLHGQESIRRLRSRHILRDQHALSKALLLRGGVRKAAAPVEDEDSDVPEDENKKPSIVDTTKVKFMSVKPVTRSYLAAVLLLTTLDLVGGEGVTAYFPMDWGLFFKGQVWRIITGAAYLGPLSMHWASNIYFLLIHGATMENNNGFSDQAVFLAFTVLLTSLLGSLIGMSIYSTAVISAFIWGSSRVNPMQPEQFQFGLSFPKFVMPFALAGLDVLQAGKPAAALPHFIGFAVGHLYVFNRRVLPLMGGRDWLAAPNWLKRRLEGDSPNFMEKPEPEKVGRKLGDKKKAASSKTKASSSSSKSSKKSS